MQFISGAATSSIFTVGPIPSPIKTRRYDTSLTRMLKICGTLLTDLNPGTSATVQASYNIVRCIGAGAAIAAQQPLADAAGTGWCFGIFAIIMLAATPPVFVLKRSGMQWRQNAGAGSRSRD